MCVSTPMMVEPKRPLLRLSVSTKLLLESAAPDDSSLNQADARFCTGWFVDVGVLHDVRQQPSTAFQIDNAFFKHITILLKFHMFITKFHVISAKCQMLLI